MANGCQNLRDDITWDFDWDECPGASACQLDVMGSTAIFLLINKLTTTASSYLYTNSGSYIVEHDRDGWKLRVHAMVNDQWGDWSEEQTFDIEAVHTDPP